MINMPHATKSVTASMCYTKSVAHATKSEAHATNQRHFLLSLIFATLKLKLVSKIFSNSCLTDLQIEASLVHFQQELLFELNVVIVTHIEKSLVQFVFIIPV